MASTPVTVAISFPWPLISGGVSINMLSMIVSSVETKIRYVVFQYECNSLYPFVKVIKLLKLRRKIIAKVKYCIVERQSLFQILPDFILKIKVRTYLKNLLVFSLAFSQTGIATIK